MGSVIIEALAKGSMQFTDYLRAMCMSEDASIGQITFMKDV